MPPLRPTGNRHPGNAAKLRPEGLFLPFEPEHPPDSMFQEPYIREIVYPLLARFTGLRPEFPAPDSNGVFISSVGFICYDPDDLNVRVASDCTIAFGVNLQYLRERNAYVVHEMGKPPDFVMEVASPSTAQNDIRTKPDIYQRIGIPEYWRFDPSGGEHYGQPLAGDRLVNGIYRPIELTIEPDGEIRGYSEALGLCICYNRNMLLFYDPAERRYLLNQTQSYSAYLESQAELAAAQARAQELEEQLRRRESPRKPEEGP